MKNKIYLTEREKHILAGASLSYCHELWNHGDKRKILSLKEHNDAKRKADFWLKVEECVVCGETSNESKLFVTNEEYQFVNEIFSYKHITQMQKEIFKKIKESCVIQQ